MNVISRLSWCLLLLLGCRAEQPIVVRTPATPEPLRVAPMPPPQPRSTDDTAWIRPCQEGPELDDAYDELRHVDAAIDRLPLDADPKPLATRVESLYGRRCFDVGEVGLDARQVDSALSLRDFWSSARIDLVERLSWGRSEPHYVWSLPSLRHALTLDATPTHPLRPLLCPSDPKSCGKETAGWAIRADHALVTRAALRSQKAPAPCANAVSFVDLSRCVDRSTPRREALPLGAFRAPTDGWLLLRGPQMENCSQLRAYDLATGAAWIARSCHGNPTVESGVLPVAALREAAWVMFLARTVDPIDVVASRQEIPAAIAIASPGRRFREPVHLRWGGTNRRLVWQWMRGKSTIASGVIDMLHLDAEEHATELLQIAEASFMKGPARSPPALPWAERTSASLRVDPSAPLPDENGDLYDELEAALARAVRIAIP